MESNNKKSRLRAPAPSPNPSSNATQEDATLMDVFYPLKIGWKRFAWPELRHFPLQTSTEPLPDSVAKLEPDIINKAHSVLKELNIVPDTSSETLDDADIEVGLELRQKPFDSASARPTLLLAIPWSWKSHGQICKAAQAMANWMIEFTSHLPSEIHVEAISPELLQTIYYDEVGIPHLSDSWDEVSDKVMADLQWHPGFRDHHTSLSLQRYGVSPILSNNPPTIYVGVDHGSKESGWYTLVDQIERTLHKLGWHGVQVHVEHNLNFSFYTFPVLTPAGDDVEDRMKLGLAANKRIVGDYSNTLHVGADFSAATYLTRTDKAPRDPGNGTLGCFIQIKTKTNPAWRTCALTNYHVVRTAFTGFTLDPDPEGQGSKPGCPPEGSDMWKVDKWGFYPNMVADANVKDKKVSEKTLKAPPAPFESPSRTKHNFTLAVIDKERTDAKKQEERARARLQITQDGPNKVQVMRNLQRAKNNVEARETEDRQKRAFFDEHKEEVGTLLLAAGFNRSVSGRRMDWAVILLNQRRPWSNNLPVGEVWASKYGSNEAYPDETFGLPITEQTRSIEGSNGVGRVFKIGSTTGPSVGKFWKEKDPVTLEEDSYLSNKRLTTKELIFAGNTFFAHGEPAKFCAKGDSGSVVFDELGGIVGLVFRGHKHERSYNDGYGYVTPIEHVFEDIVAFSKGHITDIRVAEQ
ncbi:hypothetical protein FOVSG1_010942 [Fusarium oxysporum f. sp. vasinfectum]